MRNPTPLDVMGLIPTPSVPELVGSGSRNEAPARKKFKILGKGWGGHRVHLIVDGEREAEMIAREIAAMPGQSPVAVIDTGDNAVTFYFADGEAV